LLDHLLLQFFFMLSRKEKVVKSVGDVAAVSENPSKQGSA
jgi:hypothetical protein